MRGLIPKKPPHELASSNTETPVDRTSQIEPLALELGAQCVTGDERKLRNRETPESKLSNRD